MVITFFRFVCHHAGDAEAKHDEERKVPTDEARERANGEHRVKTAAGGVILLRGDQSLTGTAIKQERTVRQRQSGEASDAKSSQRLPLPHQEQLQSDHGEQRPQRNARTSGIRQKKSGHRGKYHSVAQRDFGKRSDQDAKAQRHE